MSLTSSNIPNLAGGVSQQPPAIRLENQFESQSNAYATIVEGLSGRRPSYHLTRLMDAVGPTSFWHVINRSPTEQHVLCIAGNSLRVFNILTELEETVSFPNGTAYLVNAVPRDGFRAVSVADYSFITNLGVLCAMQSDLTPQPFPEVLFNVKLGNYGKNYGISFSGGGPSASYTTPDGSVATDADAIDTVAIASQLASQLTSTAGGAYTVRQYGSAVHVRATTATDFNVTVVDGFSGLALIALKGMTQRFTDLPTTAPEGFTIGINGNEGLQGDLYYLQFTTVDSVGVWKECVAPGIKYQPDPSTMPHQLTRNSDGTFTFSEAAWLPRNVGDETTNPDPSFIGRAVTDVFFSRNRLGFAAGENTISSRSGEFFNFFRRTITALLDDDPVDVASTSIRVNSIAWAIPFNRTLVLFSEQSQSEEGSTGVLTPSTAAIVPTSEYEASTMARPATTGTSVFFAVEQDGFAQVREYYADGQTANKVDAYNTTAHVPRYLPAGVFRLTASRSENVLAALSIADPNAIYIYSYLGDPSARSQAAWTRWDLGANVLYCEFIKADLIVVVERDGGVWLEKIPLAAGKVDTGLPYLTLLDRRVLGTGLAYTVSAALNQTTFTLPYAAAGCLAVVGYDPAYTGSLNAGQTVAVVSTSGNQIVLSGDHSTTPLIFGFTILTTIELSKIYVRERRGAITSSTKTTVAAGRLQIAYLSFQVGTTSSFRVTVEPKGRPAYTKVFNGRIVGDAQSIIGEVPLFSGVFRVPVQSRGDTTVITITHDSHLPMFILAMEWEGQFNIRSSRQT